VWVEASTALDSSRGGGPWGRSDELCAVATSDAEERRGAAPEQMQGRRGAWGIERA
jgi:hypothetical protein